MFNSKNNHIFIYKNDKKYKLRHKIKGLNVIFNESAKNCTLNLYMPISFINTTIQFNGNMATITIKSSEDTIDSAYMSAEAYGEIFIDKDSKFTSPNLTLIANNNTKENPSRIIIGKNALISNDVLMRTSDGHALFNLGEELPYNAPQDIIVGDNVWIGTRTVILKGSTIPSNSVIGACSLINKKFDKENTIIVGNPAKVVKENIFWKRKGYGTCTRQYQKAQLPKRKSEKTILIKKLKRKLSKIKFFSNL